MVVNPAVVLLIRSCSRAAWNIRTFTYIYSACEGDVYYIGRVGTMQEGLAGLTNSLPLRVCLYKTMLHCT